MVLTLPEIQNYGTEMLRTVAEICEKNNLRWYMAYGSALGAIRHHGPIPWDYDIDIYVPDCDLPRFIDVMREQLPAKYWIDYRENTNVPRSFPRIGLAGYETEILHIDVYRLGGLPTDIKQFRHFVKYSRLLFVTWKSKTLDIDFYYPDIKRRLVSKTVKALTSFIPMNLLLNLIDKQAGKVPFDEAEIVASPLTTESRRRTIDRHVFDESILVDYCDFKVRVPKEYGKYLETVFDDWRELPPPEYREKMMKDVCVVRELKE